MAGWKSIAGGFLIGTLGVHVLTSREAKVVYSYITAAVLHGKDDVVTQAGIIKENSQDIYRRAKKINEDGIAREKACMIYDEPDEKDAPSAMTKEEKKQ